MAKITRTGAQAFVDCLEQQGTEYIFGYPGGVVIPVFDALLDSSIKLIHPRHEQGGTHMADGYARTTGKPGVVLVTSGPGATNTITGIMTAHMDSSPMIVVSGQVTTAVLGLDAFQETDMSGLTFPIVKYSFLLKKAEDIPRVVKEAFHIAQTGRPGPVLIDLPKDISITVFEPDYNVSINLPGYTIPTNGDSAEIAKAAEALQKAERPLIIAGHGAIISDACKAIKQLAEKMQIPVTNTLLGKGAFPENHELSLGMLGMHGTAYANMAILHCDLVMSIGSRWDDRITGKLDEFCPGITKIHIDIDASEAGKMVKPDIFILGDARLVMEELNASVRKGKTKDWITKIDKWKKQYPLKYRKQGGLKAQYILDTLNTLTNGDAIFCTDVGQHQMWAAQFCKVRHRFHWISSGGAGTMGFGMPAAIGAQLAKPDSLVISISGDGGFQMTQSDLATAALHKLPIKMFIIDNKYLGMVRQWQDMFFDNRLSGVDLKGSPDFVKLAEAYGIKAFRIKRNADVERIVKAALEYDSGPCLIHAEVEKEDNVFPMIPAGASYDKMILDGPRKK